jgi:hypothetical protein
MDEFLSSAELRDVLRFSLRASAESTLRDFSSKTAGGPEIDPKNPAVRRLIEQILFSRRFILTYYLAIGGFVVLFTVLCHGRKILRLRKRRARFEEAGLEKKQNQPQLAAQYDDGGSNSVASSSSSTLQGAQSPPCQNSAKSAAGERTSLIGREHATSSDQPFHNRLNAFLMYQPRPIFAITSSQNVLPDNSTSVVIVLFLTLNVFYLFYRTPLSIPMLFALADRAGLCFVANLPVLYILSAKNNQPIRGLTGWSYEGLNIFHRRLGEWMIILALLHTIGMFGVWFTLLRPAHFTLLRFLSSKVILLGLSTFLAYVVLWGTSTGIFRQLYYEYFLGLHILVQVAALVLLFFHHSGSRPYVLAALAIWIIDRILLRMIVSPVKLRADLKVAADKETVLLFCDIPVQKASSSRLRPRRHILQGWQPGQHVFVTIPALGLEHKLQAHPFTIASPAPPRNHTDTWPLQLIIRAKDGFSKDLLSFASSQASAETSVEVVLDGPYGSNNTLEALRSADRVCLFAGGSGIAVTYPYAWTLLVRDEPEALVWQSFDSDTRTSASEPLSAIKPDHRLFKARDEQFHHLWVRSSSLHQLWLALHPVHESMVIRNDQHDHKITNNIPFERASVGNLFSWTPYNNPTQESGAGRPDVARELRAWVEDDIDKGHGKAVRKERSICVVVSGPDGMVRDVRNAAAGLVAEGWILEVHVEKFGW